MIDKDHAELIPPLTRQRFATALRVVGKLVIGGGLNQGTINLGADLLAHAERAGYLTLHDVESEWRKAEDSRDGYVRYLNVMADKIEGPVKLSLDRPTEDA